MIIFGVDTGLTGALAAIHHTGQPLGVIDMPVIQLTDKLKLVDGMELHMKFRELRELGMALELAPQCRAYMEATSARPGLHANACHSMGRTLGGVVSVVQILGYPVEFSPPSQWKRDMKINSKDGDHGLHMARALFPSMDLRLKKHHNRADALLIAEWGRRRAYSQGLFATPAVAS